jgi:hypothetical protein
MSIEKKVGKHGSEEFLSIDDLKRLVHLLEQSDVDEEPKPAVG